MASSELVAGFGRGRRPGPAPLGARRSRTRMKASAAVAWCLLFGAMLPNTPCLGQEPAEALHITSRWETLVKLGPRRWRSNRYRSVGLADCWVSDRYRISTSPQPDTTADTYGRRGVKFEFYREWWGNACLRWSGHNRTSIPTRAPRVRAHSYSR